jgi:glyoxylase-like metal-dependent hydrolase (beta-lactamase superfamily II)/8-oxo-dGTP pyrophosphatase MutT (NUDIX family)
VTEPEPAVPIRPSATVVLLRDTVHGLETFLLHRVAGLPFAAGMSVFPGGAVDPGDYASIARWRGPSPQVFAEAFGVDDGAAVVSAATRELFEETGVALVARPGEPVRPALLSASLRAELVSQRTSWPTVLREAGLELCADLLRPWVRRITPLGPSRRYDTSFFVVRLPAGQIPDADTSEAHGGIWVRPADALAAAAAGELALMRPTVTVLTELANHGCVDDVLAARRPLPFPPMSAGSAPDLVRRSAFTRSRLAPNPGPMTLDGTNSYVIAAPDSASVVVVDPGPLDARHLHELAARPVELVLITHHHLDHTEASAAFHALTGAPVRAFDPAFCIGGEPLTDGAEIVAAGTRIRVLATPGHTADSVCFILPDDDDGVGSVLTGDTILGRGTTIIAHPGGRLGDYLASLDRLAAVGSATVLPAHGPVRPDLAAVAAEYAAHRQLRLDQIRDALGRLGPDAGVAAVTDLVYADVPADVRRAAETSVAAQLEYLRS